MKLNCNKDLGLPDYKITEEDYKKYCKFCVENTDGWEVRFKPYYYNTPKEDREKPPFTFYDEGIKVGRYNSFKEFFEALELDEALINNYEDGIFDDPYYSEWNITENDLEKIAVNYNLVDWYDTIKKSREKSNETKTENKIILENNIKFKSNEEGRCPICNSQMIEYFGMELEDTAVYYPWHCPDCGTDGKEWYYVDFSEVESNSGAVGEEEGSCPDCGAEIECGTAKPDWNSLGYEYFCPECENSGTEWYDLDFDSHTINGHEDEEIELIKEAINYKDDKLNVTTAEDPTDDREYYGRNMTKRDKVRSLDQAKRNLDRMEKDPRVTQGQAIDQVSFDSALDTDLAYYKHNKDMAKIDKAQGNDFWADEHNKTAKQFADKIRAKHKKQKENETLKLSDKMKEINIKKPDDDIDGNKVVDVKGKYGNMKSIKVDKDKLTITPSIARQINKKQEAIDDDEEENNIDFDDTISLLDMALSEIPTVGVEDWGKDDELLFTADTKVMFENLKNYEEEIPKYYYDNASNDDWSNGIDSYLEEIKGVNLNNGDSDNTYNWNAPLTHDVEFTIYEADDGCYFKGSIHRAGDVRGNYTTEFLLKFDSKDDCLETLFDTCSENCYRSVTVDDVEYVVSPHFFNEYVDIWNTKTQESYDDVYCDCIDKLKEIIAENKQDEKVDENFKSKKEEVSSGYAEFLYNQQKANNFKNEQDEIKRAQKITMLQDKIDHRRDSLADLGLRYFEDGNVHKIFTLADNKLYDECTIKESDVLEKLNKIDAFLSEIINKRKAEGTIE